MENLIINTSEKQNCVNIAVKCSTDAQKIEVIKYARDGKNLYTPSPATSECISLENGCHCNESYYIREEFTIIPYEEFEKRYLKKEEPKKEFNEPVTGEYYTHTNGNICRWGGDDSDNYLRPLSSSFGKRGSFTGTGLTPATMEEKQWLQVCIEANKFIPREEALKSKIMNLEKGKWYKGWKDKACKFAKFHHISVSGGVEYFHWTDGIHTSWKGVNQGSGCNNWINDTTLVEASLEEIQQYLPEGHIDKLPMKQIFETGKWYEFTQGSKQYGKYNRSAGDTVYFEPWICNTTSYSISGAFSPSTLTDIKEIDISTVQKYLPEGHADKIIITPKIVNGTWYKCKVKSCAIIPQDRWYLFKYSERVGEDRKTYGSKGIHLRDNTIFHNNAVCDNKELESLELANMEEVYRHFPEEKEEKMAKFEIGKWYAVTAWNKKWKIKTNSVIHDLESISWLDSDNKYHGNGGVWQLDKITESKEINVSEIQEYLPIGHPDKQKTMKFKVDDEVSFKTSNDNIPSFLSGGPIPGHFIKHGSVVFKENKGKVEHIHNEYYIVSFVDKSGQTVQLGFKEEVLQPIQPKVVVLKVGMYLKALKDGPQGCANLVKKGDFGKVMYVYSGNNSGTVDFPKNKSYSFTLNDNLYEVMPEWWVPPITEKPVTLVGRWLKALVDNPNNISNVKAGQYIYCKDKDSVGYTCEADKGFNYICGTGMDRLTDGTFELMPIGWKPEDAPIVEKKAQEPEIDYIGQVIGHGEGMHPNDIGKHIRVLKGRPSGNIANDVSSYDLYIQGLPSVSYTTNFTSPGMYGRCGEKMVRKLGVPEIPEKEWCVRITPENKKDLLGYLKNKFESNYEGDSNYYGVAYSGKSSTCSGSSWGRLLTDKEFYEEILGKPMPGKGKVEKVKTEADYPYVVVNCRTQDQWDFILEKTGKHLTSSTWSTYGEDQCIAIDGESHSSKKFFSNQGSLIYSFEEWCKKKGYSYYPPEKKEEISSDWSVFMTPENKDDIVEYFSKVPGCSFSGSGGWYGIKAGSPSCCSYSWSNVLTSEQWYAKIKEKQPKVRKASKGKLLSVIKGGSMDTSVKKVRSLSGNLVKRKKVVLF